MPFKVWIDATHVRRVQFEDDMSTWGIDLWDFGVSTDALDWTRIPDWPAPQNQPRLMRLLSRRMG